MGTRACEQPAGRASGGCEGHTGPVGALTFASIYVDPPFSFLPRSPFPGSVSTALLPFTHSKRTASLSGHSLQCHVTVFLTRQPPNSPPPPPQTAALLPPALRSMVPALGEESVE